MFDQTARLGLLCSLVWLEYVGIVAGNKNIKNPWKVGRLQSAHQKTLGGGNSNIFFHVHLYLGGRWTHFDDHIFQMGWFNHQPELLVFLDVFCVGDIPWAPRPPPNTRTRPPGALGVFWAAFGGENSCFWWWNFLFWWWNFLFLAVKLPVLVVKLPVFGGETSVLVVKLPVFGGETSCFGGETSCFWWWNFLFLVVKLPVFGGETSCFWWWNFLFLVVKLPVFGGETSYRLTKKDGSLKFNRGVSITVPYCTYIGGIKQMQMYIW